MVAAILQNVPQKTTGITAGELLKHNNIFLKSNIFLVNFKKILFRKSLRCNNCSNGCNKMGYYATKPRSSEMYYGSTAKNAPYC